MLDIGITLRDIECILGIPKSTLGTYKQLGDIKNVKIYKNNIGNHNKLFQQNKEALITVLKNNKFFNQKSIMQVISQTIG